LAPSSPLAPVTTACAIGFSVQKSIAVVDVGCRIQLSTQFGGTVRKYAMVDAA